MRASDIPVVSPVHASMVTSGAASRTIALIKAAHIPFYTEGSKGFYRSTERAARRTTSSPTSTRSPRPPRPRPRRRPTTCSWGSDTDLPKGIKATTIGAQFSGGHTTQWQFINGSYHNLNSNAPAGDQFPATQRARAAGQGGRRGLPRPGRQPGAQDAPGRQGQRAALPQRPDGRRQLAKGTAPDSQIKLTTKKGAALKVPAGHTWIELVPLDGGNVTFKK